MSESSPPVKYVSMHVTRPARHALQQATLQLSAELGVRLVLSDVLHAALIVAAAHADEHRRTITELIGETS